ncbi:hypothetical protein [Streptomyces sp. NPDC050704]|uniref:hypothetical protein n=1 Tax=Streptomyces sp. NPDC050704 TaxID=3157219 RepID=UPI00341AA0F0
MPARAPKTRTAPVPAPVEDDGVLRISTTSAPSVEEVRVPLCYIDDEEFTVPKVIDERIVFLALNSMRDDGPLFSSQRVVELVLGKPQYNRLLALYERKKIEQKDFDTIVKTVSALFFDHMNSDDDAAGKGSPAS